MNPDPCPDKRWWPSSRWHFLWSGVRWVASSNLNRQCFFTVLHVHGGLVAGMIVFLFRCVSVQLRRQSVTPIPSKTNSFRRLSESVLMFKYILNLDVVTNEFASITSIRFLRLLSAPPIAIPVVGLVASNSPLKILNASRGFFRNKIDSRRQCNCSANVANKTLPSMRLKRNNIIF